MRTHFRHSHFCLPVFLLLLCCLAPAFAWEMKPAVRTLPLFFVEDSTPAGARFWAQTPTMRAEFTRAGVTFAVKGNRAQVRFAGASNAVKMEGTESGGEASVKSGVETRRPQANLLLGSDPAQWRTGLPVHDRIHYRELYPGIDLTYAGKDGALKSEFIVRPGADPQQIVLQYSAPVEIAVNGDLIVGSSSAAPLREAKPVIYQESAGRQIPIDGHFHQLGARSVGFEIGAYDPALPLVIDPTISYSTYIGGTGLGAVTGVALDSSGNLYAAGWTEALNFPIAGAYQAANLGGVDAFVVKFSPNGSTLLYATYIGGAGDDRAAGIAVDSNGGAYITGSTSSFNFPTVAAIRSTLGAQKTAFALKLNAAGTGLVYSTYLGGTGYEVGTAIAVDTNGNAFVVGDTQSVNFPVAFAVQPTLRGMTDAFVTKLNPTGTLVFSTYLGGSAVDHAGGVAVDASGNVYVTGGTYSTNFPVAAPLQSSNGGGQDIFVTKLTANGGALIFSTYLGGNGALTPEQANAIALDASGNAYIAGVTNSLNCSATHPSSCFPVTSGAYQTQYNGSQDAFVAKLNSAGNTLVYCSYLGGTQFDWATGIAVDAAGNAYVSGYTSSQDFATAGAVQNTFAGLYDGFAAEINAAGNTLLFSTFYGGSGADAANAIVVDTNGNIFTGGQTSSANFPLASAVQSSNNGYSVGWVARLGVTAPPNQFPLTSGVSPSSGSGNTVSFASTYLDSAGAAALTTVGLLLNTSASTALACYVTYNQASNIFTLANDDPSTGSLTVIPGGGSQQNSQCQLNGAGSSVSVQGAFVTVTVSLTFLPGFGGSKTVYLSAADALSSTGWVARGTWTAVIPPPLPSADSVSPSGATGASGSFTFVFSDTQDAANLTGMAMLFGNSVSTSNNCYLVYDRTAGSLSLLWDGGNGSNSRPIASSTTLQNSQCSVGNASARVSGTSQIITVNIAFKGAFSGVQNVYLYGSEGSTNTGWVQRGTFTVAAGGVPTAGAVVPGAGSGPAQRFSFTFSDQGGSGYLTGLAMLIAPTLNTANACSIVYDRNANVLSLAFDNPANGASSIVLGSSGVANNSQCTLRGANSTVLFSATSVVVTLDLSFNSAWFGAKNIYSYAGESGVNSGWITTGSWTVQGGTPSADSVSPSSGAGMFPSLSFSVSDTFVHSNISGVGVLITAGSPANLTNACYVVFDRPSGTVRLYNDTALGYSSKPLGSSANLLNSQCAVGYTVIGTSGNALQFTLSVLFYPAFSGAKSVYLQAFEPTSSSGWVARGAWSVQ